MYWNEIGNEPRPLLVFWFGFLFVRNHKNTSTLAHEDGKQKRGKASDNPIRNIFERKKRNMLAKFKAGKLAVNAENNPEREISRNLFFLSLIKRWVYSMGLWLRVKLSLKDLIPAARHLSRIRPVSPSDGRLHRFQSLGYHLIILSSWPQPFTAASLSCHP